MRFKIGQKLTIRTAEEVYEKMKRNGDFDLINDTNFDLFRRYGNKTAVVEETYSVGGSVLLYLYNGPPMLRIAEQHIPYVFKNNLKIELDNTLFEL